MDAEKKLQAINVSCVRQQKKLFSDLSFTLTAGELLLIEGQNGAGKSSLLRLLSGLATPFSGDVFWQGESIHSARAAYHEQLHYMGHSNGIKLGLTVSENLELAAHLSSSRIPSFENILESLQLSSYQNTLASYLSAGQKRRIALAKLFLYPKMIWLLDEPLTALDKHTQSIFLAQLKLHLKNGGIAIVSSHHTIHVDQAVIHTLRLESC